MLQRGRDLLWLVLLYGATLSDDEMQEEYEGRTVDDLASTLTEQMSLNNSSSSNNNKSPFVSTTLAYFENVFSAFAHEMILSNSCAASTGKNQKFCTSSPTLHQSNHTVWGLKLVRLSHVYPSTR